jgi:arylsulfatase A-like enzyme
MDKSLGDLLDHLVQLGVAENTLVIFLGDNGSDAPLGNQHQVACAAPLRGKKGAHYEGGMRVPFIAAWAKTDNENSFQKALPIPQGALQVQMANVCDLMPTILQVADVDSPKNHKLDGAPLNRLLSGQPDPEHEQTFLMHFPHSPHRSEYYSVLRDRDWKVIYHYHPSKQSDGQRYQLYNLIDDPFEQADLSESHPEELASMMQKLVRSLEDHSALYPVNADRSRELRPIMPTAVASKK